MFDKPRSGYHVALCKQHEFVKNLIYEPEAFCEYAKVHGKDVFQRVAGVVVEHTIVKHWATLGFRQVYPDLDAAVFCASGDPPESMLFSDLIDTLPPVAINIPRELKINLNIGLGDLSFVVVSSCPVMTPDKVMDYIGGPGKGVLRLDSEIWLGSAPRLLLFFDSGNSMHVEMAHRAIEQSQVADNYKPKAWYRDERIGAEEKEMDVGPLETVKHLVANLMILMRSFPKYVHKEASKIRFDGRTINVQQMSVTLNKELKYQVEVPEQPPQHPPYNHTGVRMPYHMRRWHWRRQPHGENWDGDSIELGHFPDGRPWHLVIIPRLEINVDLKPKD